MTTPHAELRELAAAAIASSPTQTRLDDFKPEDFGREDSDDGPFQGAMFFWPWARYIAAAVNAAPTLLSEVERLRAALEQADVVMEAAMLRGLFSTPETQRSVAGQLWATAHQAVRAALATSAGGG